MTLEPWSYNPTDNPSEMDERVERMRDILELLDHDPLATGKCSVGDLITYCYSLINGQRRAFRGIKSGSWSVIPPDTEHSVKNRNGGIPADARVDFAFMPTYLAVSILTRVLFDYPWIAVQISRYSQTLRRGLKFCSYRNLTGSGFDRESGMIDAMLVLTAGKVPFLLEIAPSFSPELAKVIGKVENEIRLRMENHSFETSWGENLESGYNSVLETLHLYRDKDLIETIKKCRDLPSSDFSDTLPW